MALSELAKKVRQGRLTYLSEQKFGRLEATLRAVIAARTEGAIAEFGVALGGSAIVLASQALAAGRSFHGFDVFGMIPPPASEKDSPKSKERFEIIQSGKSSGLGPDKYYGYIENLYDRVCQSFSEFGIEVGQKGIHLHKGLFQDVVPDVDMKSLCFVHIDCDFYDAVKYALSSSWPLLSVGGCVMFDDYHTHGGCKAAVDEYFVGRDDYVFGDGANFKVMKRQPA